MKGRVHWSQFKSGIDGLPQGSEDFLVLVDQLKAFIQFKNEFRAFLHQLHDSIENHLFSGLLSLFLSSQGSFERNVDLKTRKLACFKRHLEAFSNIFQKNQARGVVAQWSLINCELANALRGQRTLEEPNEESQRALGGNQPHF